MQNTVYTKECKSVFVVRGSAVTVIEALVKEYDSLAFFVFVCLQSLYDWMTKALNHTHLHFSFA